ncbi:MAG TPA: hypothetical protein VM222_01760 [Planctomycetota bacterium]|nr:hypothetical protein [Planctomycetota bacterium]
MTTPVDPQGLRSELQRASEHAKALALEVGDDDDLRAFYGLISDIVDALVNRCPGFGPDDTAQTTARVLDQQEGPTEAEQSDVEKAVRASTQRPPSSPFPPEA